MLPQLAFSGLVLVVGFGAHLLRRSLAVDPVPDAPIFSGASSGESSPLAATGHGLDAHNASATPAVGTSQAREPSAAPSRPQVATAAKPVRAARSAGTSGAATAASDTPEVANVLAREALRLVGVDPQALVIWKRAINDPALPAADRSDLIEDLNDEGYDEQGAFTENDLQLILARLELIEHEMPLAMDSTNAWAFTEAYKDLLGMLAKARADVAAKTTRR